MTNFYLVNEKIRKILHGIDRNWHPFIQIIAIDHNHENNLLHYIRQFRQPTEIINVRNINCSENCLRSMIWISKSSAVLQPKVTYVIDCGLKQTMIFRKFY